MRVYHQIQAWKGLCETDIEQFSWSMQICNGKFRTIMPDIAAGLAELLKIIRCGCKGQCRNKCSYRKAGMQCTPSCEYCHEIICSNVPQSEAFIYLVQSEVIRLFLHIF